MPCRFVTNSTTLNDHKPTYNASFSGFFATSVNFRSAPRQAQWSYRHTQCATKKPIESSFRRYKVHQHIRKESPVTHVVKQPDPQTAIWKLPSH